MYFLYAYARLDILLLPVGADPKVLIVTDLVVVVWVERDIDEIVVSKT